MCANEAEQNLAKGEKKESKRIVSVASWIDLLGYGWQIGSVNFDPYNPNAQEPHKRLRKFHKTVECKAKQRVFPTLVMNDGAVAYRDLTSNSSDTYDFLKNSWDLYSKVNEEDCIGARMVLASGFRYLGSDVGNEHTKENLEKILDDFWNKKITKEEAVQKVYPLRPPFGILPQLQENFAFSRAYIAEKSGSKGNLPGPRFYVDLNLFKCVKEFEPYIKWSSSKLNLAIRFVEIKEFDEISHCMEMNNECQVARCLVKGLTEQNELNEDFKVRIKSLESKIQEMECEIETLRTE